MVAQECADHAIPQSEAKCCSITVARIGTRSAPCRLEQEDAFASAFGQSGKHLMFATQIARDALSVALRSIPHEISDQLREFRFVTAGEAYTPLYNPPSQYALRQSARQRCYATGDFALLISLPIGHRNDMSPTAMSARSASHCHWPVARVLTTLTAMFQRALMNAGIRGRPFVPRDTPRQFDAIDGRNTRGLNVRLHQR